MKTIEFNQKSMLTQINDDGLQLRIQKQFADKIKKEKLLGRRLDVKIIIKY